jgi:hypothetical protein
MKAVVSLVCVVLLLAPAAREVRTWKDKSGKFSIRAELVESDGTTVKLKKEDGKVISVPVDRLSDQDRQFLESQEKSAFGGAAPGEAGKMVGPSGAKSGEVPKGDCRDFRSAKIATVPRRGASLRLETGRDLCLPGEDRSGPGRRNARTDR